MAEILVVWLAVGPGLLALGWWGRRCLARKQKSKGELVLTPPLGDDRGPAATADLFVALARLMGRRSLPAKLLGYRPVWQLQVRATPAAGCQFVWRLPDRDRPAAERLLAGYWPGIRIRTQNAYGYNYKTVCRLKPAKFLAGPDQARPDWDESDPAGYLTSQLGQTGGQGVVAYSLGLQAGPVWRFDPGSLALAAVSRLTACFLSIFQPAVGPSGEAALGTAPIPEIPAETASFVASGKLLAAPKLARTGAARNLLPALGLMGLQPTRLFGGSRLTPAQAAALWHFPNSGVSPHDNLDHALSRTRPLPTALLAGPGPADLVIGAANHRGHQGRPIYLSPSARQRHVYIVGGTGVGKTTMIKDQVAQDMRAGRGVGVVDPHGDLAAELVDLVPPGRVDDLVLVDPDDCQRPVQINLLELEPGLSGFDLERQKDLVTESTVSVLRKLFAADGEGGHRIEYILRNSIQTALTIPDPTLFTIYDLLQDPKFRRTALAGLDNPHLKLFWQQELGRAGDYQRVKMTAGVTAKIGRFLFSTPTRLTFGAAKSNIDFGQIMDGGKILICDLSRGKLGEDCSRLFGAAVLAKIQLAALTRARQPPAGRRPFYLYVDEFQNFATTSFVEMMSEARKYQLLLTLAEQSTSQQSDQKLVETILANTGTIVAFRSGSPADAAVLQPLLAPQVEPLELVNLPAFNFYARLAASEPAGPVSGVTRPDAPALEQ